MEPRTNLLIDDNRTPAYIQSTYGLEVHRHAMNFSEGIAELKNGNVSILFLDHDLSSYDSEGEELTGTDIMRFLLENTEYLPEEIIVVSANPVGAKRMREMAKEAYERREREANKRT